MSEFQRRELPYPWDEIKRRLQRDVLRLLDRLGIREPVRGGLVTPRNPTRVDRNPGSFVIWVAGDGVGAWKDYATGEGGDLFDLVAYLGGLADKMSVYWWSLDFLGLPRSDGVVRTKDQALADRERFERERKAAEARAEAEEGAKSGSLKAAWLSLPASIAGTPAETYLRQARGIPLERLKHLPGALRWAPVLEWIDPTDGEIHTWRNVMVSAMTKGSDLTGLHLTFLKPDGSGKADRDKTKLIYGRAKGAAIRLSSGASGLSPKAAAAKGRQDPLVIGEGIETVLTCCCARPDYRGWAAGSLGNMRGFAWPDCASAVILLLDNDQHPTALAEAERVEAHWGEQSRGRPLKAIRSAVGSDFNDWVKA